MKSRAPQKLFLVGPILFFMALAPSAFAQSPPAPGTLHGIVTDPSGAVVPGVSISVSTPDGRSLTATTNRQGAFDLKNLPPGKYTVEASAKSFAPYANDDVEIAPGQIHILAIPLLIEEQEQQVTVSGEAPTVSVNPENNAGAIVISGKELDALSDDPDELASDLQALAGPSAGPNGGQLYIDGFTAGQLPPKSSIREIRINQNPFSAEYDKLGYGRIEIFTKPGTDKFHGRIEVQGNDSALNSKNPFAKGVFPGYDKIQFEGSVSGPISRKASFFLSAQYRDINDVSIVNACVPGSGPQVNCRIASLVPFVASVPNRLTRTNISPRIDLQITPTNTLTVRYQYFRDNETNQGIGGLSLPSQGYNALSTEQTLQVSDTQIFGANIVNETHFQYIRDVSNQVSLCTAATISPQCTAIPASPGTVIMLPVQCNAFTFTLNVSGAFTCGGNLRGTDADTQNHYEIQNYTSWAHGKHFLKFGVRLRDVSDNDFSTSGFNGQFAFPSTAALQGNSPNQFSLTSGIPVAHVNLFDAGLYIQDDWRVKPNITLSGGLRFETQNHISDHADWAPRVSLAWGLGHGKTPKTVLRAGWGIFYDRFQDSNVLQENRLNGTIQTEDVLPSSQAPDCFPNLSAPACTSDLGMPSVSTIYRIPNTLHAPYTMQTALTLERQLTKISTLSVTYLNSRGVHQFVSNSIGTPGAGNLYQYQSDGVFKQNQLIVNINVRASSKLALFGYYVLSYANSDTSGVNSFQSTPFNLSQDYGRASFDTRNRLFFGGSILLPHAFRVSPFLIASSGRPFNVTTPIDILGTTQFNQRPCLISAATCLPNPMQPVSIFATPLGTFDADPAIPYTPIPINNFTGPSYFSLNLRISKSFGFGSPRQGSGGRVAGGGEGGGGGEGRRGGPGGNPFGIGGGEGGGGFGGGNASNRPYTLTLSVNARNIFNDVNLGPPVGVLGSPSFNQSISTVSGFGPGGPSSSTSGANRLIYLQASFDF